MQAQPGELAGQAGGQQGSGEEAQEEDEEERWSDGEGAQDGERQQLEEDTVKEEADMMPSAFRHARHTKPAGRFSPY